MREIGRPVSLEYPAAHLLKLSGYTAQFGIRSGYIVAHLQKDVRYAAHPDTADADKMNEADGERAERTGAIVRAVLRVVKAYHAFSLS